jgi:hypothetical protein
MPQKRIRDMKVVERDGRKIVTIGNVGSSKSPLRAALRGQPQDGEEEGDHNEKKEQERGGGKKSAENKEASPVAPVAESAQVPPVKMGEVG